LSQIIGAVRQGVTEGVAEAFQEQKTESASMSKAKTEFTNNLLGAMDYTISMKPERFGTVQEHEFSWEPSEEARTPAAGERLATLMNSESMSVPLEFVPVTGFRLRAVQNGKRKATGKADLRVAKRGWKPPTDNAFSQATGLVELKVETNVFSEAQLHLELVSVSMASVFKQGVALLATDCLKRWGVWSFESKNVISGVWYLDSREAIADFKKKMETVQQRCDALQLPTIAEHDDNTDNDLDKQGGDSNPKGGQGGAPKKPPPGPESKSVSSPPKKHEGVHDNMAAALYEQDLLGFEEISEHELEAFHREQFLTTFARALLQETGEECSVPIWARAAHTECREAYEETGGSRTPTSAV
jgi:hypothetical protein